MTDLSPREIVSELDRFIVGQNDAKRAVAVALRNRWRRKRVPEDLRDEVTPKNILMIGPTGVGKTEIARRLAKLGGSPFLKVEATKFTEVGYVGRDVDQIMRDLVESALVIVRDKRRTGVKAQAEGRAEERILDALVGPGSQPATRDSFRKKLRAGELDDKEIEIALTDTASPMPGFDLPGGGNVGMINLSEMLGKMGGPRSKTVKLTVRDAVGPLVAEESDNLLDQDSLTKEALLLAENEGIVFLDEIDKVAARQGASGGDVSREGVQRDLLPLIEGTTVSTKYGPVRSDHVLFIRGQSDPSEPGPAGDRGGDAGVHRRRCRGHGRCGGGGQWRGREHRRATAADGAGKGAGRDQFQGGRPVRPDHHLRRQGGECPGRRPGQKRGSEPLHPLRSKARP